MYTNKRISNILMQCIMQYIVLHACFADENKKLKIKRQDKKCENEKQIH